MPIVTRKRKKMVVEWSSHAPSVTRWPESAKRVCAFYATMSTSLSRVLTGKPSRMKFIYLMMIMLMVVMKMILANPKHSMQQTTGQFYASFDVTTAALWNIPVLRDEWHVSLVIGPWYLKETRHFILQGLRDDPWRRRWCIPSRCQEPSKQQAASQPQRPGSRLVWVDLGFLRVASAVYFQTVRDVIWNWTEVIGLTLHKTYNSVPQRDSRNIDCISTLQAEGVSFLQSIN